MRVGVVGAGLAGLAAASRLASAGAEVLVFEKSRGLGGRLASRRTDGGHVVDHGAPALDIPPGSELERAVLAVCGAEASPMPAPSGTRLPHAPMSHPVVFADGLTRFAKRMAESLNVHRGVRVGAIRSARGGFELGDEQGNALGRFDALVVSAPAPQAADLMERSPEPDRAEPLREVTYHPAVVVALGVSMPAAAVAWLSAPDHGVVERLAVEDMKGRTSLDGVAALVATLTPQASAARLDLSADDDIAAEVLDALSDTLGAPVTAEWRQVKRWRFSTVRHRVDASAANPDGSRIVVCGDGLCPAGMAAVFRSGSAAADRLLRVTA